MAQGRDRAWVYAIGAMLDESTVEAIKIGMTGSSVTQRMRTLQTASFRPLRLLAFDRFESAREAREEESAAHAVFAVARLEGEWFLPTPGVTDYVRALSFQDWHIQQSLSCIDAAAAGDSSHTIDDDAECSCGGPVRFDWVAA